MKKILSILLVVLMLVGMLPINAMHVHAAESKYVKVTENLTDWSGEYLIVYEAGKVIFDGSLTTLDTQKKAKTVTISNNTISVDSKHSFTIAKSGSSYTIKSASGYYIGNTSNNNKLLSSTSTAYTNTIKLNTDTDKTVQITGSGSSVLRFNKTDSEMRFRYYKSNSYSNQQAICLYKLEEATTCQHTNTTTTTENATCTEAGSTIVTCKDCGAEVSKTVIDPTGHKYDTNGVCSVCHNTLPVVSFVVPSQVAGIDNRVADENGDVELPAAGDYTGSGAKHDYTFLGWMDQSLSETTDEPEVYKAGETIKVTENTTLYAVYTYSVAGTGSSTKYVLTDLANIGDSDTVVITVTNTSGTTYALTSANGSSSAPTAVEVTVSENALTGTIADDLKWNIVGDDTFVIYPAGDTSKWLYCKDANNGIRVGTITTKTFQVDKTYGYLQNTDYSRYVGVYNNADWRSYTTNPTSNNIKGQTLGFYVETTEASSQDYYTSTLESEETTCQHTNTTTTTVPATCTEAGSTTVTCDACGDTVSLTEIPATGHTEVVDEAKAPTCSQTGLTEGSHCSVCNTVITAPQTIPATGEHTYVDGTCSSCGAAKPVVGANRYYIAAIRSNTSGATGNVYYMTNTLTTTSTKRYAAEDSGSTSIPERITEPETDKVFVLVDNGDGTYKIYAEGLTEDAKYLGHSSGNSGAFVTEANAKNVTLAYDANGAVTIAYDTRNLTLNNASGNNYFAWYGSVQATVYLIPVGEACKHPNAENHEEQAATCENVGYTAGVYCTDCEKYIEGHEEIPATGHSWNEGEVTTAATCLTAGEKTVTCQNDNSHTKTEVIPALGHSYDEGVVTKPTITEDGYITYTCTVCGHSYQEVIPAIGPLKFSTATLTLTQNLSINFRAKGELFAEGAYSQPYAVFKFGYEELTVTDYVIVDGKYEFTCYNISPSQMTETVSATLYGYFDGELIEGETMTYSVGQYCLTLLNGTSDKKLHTLIVDMLYYGDEASKFANYRTEVPATSILTEEQKELHTTAVPSLKNVLDKPARVENAKASWKAVTLVLDDTVEIRYRLAAESIDGLTAQITAGGNSWTVDAFTPVPGESGQYYVKFDQLSAAMMRETVLITIYEGSTAVSDTLSYSVESYAYAQQNNAKLTNLVLEMMRYGDSVYSYFTKEDV